MRDLLPIPPLVFAVTQRDSMCEFIVRGPRPRVVSTLFSAIQGLSGTPGFALVELADAAPREWVTGAVPKAKLLAGLLGIRDLLGAGRLDIAVFSPSEAEELHLDRLGTLEVRAGDWRETSWTRTLVGQGYGVVEQLPALPTDAPLPEPWPADGTTRVQAVIADLDLESTAS